MQMPNYGGNANTSNPNKPVITTTTNPSTVKSNTPKEHHKGIAVLFYPVMKEPKN